MKFRYDINALRAIAVIGVILFHYKVPFFSGGFSGVDVFFVISGYLMSRIIIGGLNKQSFSFKEFYGNRVKRIVPALLALVLGLTLLCFLFYFPAAYKSFQVNAASSIAFVSNIVYWRQSNYFAPKADTNLLLHTWSLSVEWQFYLIYPVLLLGLGKVVKKRSVYLIVFVSVTLLVFLISALYNAKNQTATFYLLPFRCWEMMFGGIAFLTEGYASRLKYKRVLVILAYAAIFSCFLWLDSDLSWPGVTTLLPVFFTFMVIILNVNDLKLLQYGPVQFAGRISYSLYLWHWPVYVLARNIGIAWDWMSITVCIIISVALAFLSYRYIESDKKTSNKRILAAMTMLFIVCAGLGYFTVNHIMFKPGTLEISNYIPNHVKERAEQFNKSCFVDGDDVRLKDYNLKDCLNPVQTKRNILLIGDSHAAELSGSLRAALNKKGINLLQITPTGCLPVLGTTGKKGCVEIMNYVYMDFIKKNAAKLDGVIIDAHWINAPGGDQKRLLTKIKNTIKYLADHNIKAVVIGQTESYTIAYSFIAAREYQYNINLRQRYINYQPAGLNVFLRKNLAPWYIEIYNAGEVPKLTRDNVPYMFDSDHYTRYGADLAVEKILASPAVARLLGDTKEKEGKPQPGMN